MKKYVRMFSQTFIRQSSDKDEIDEIIRYEMETDRKL
jgi:hypothetical protein